MFSSSHFPPPSPLLSSTLSPSSPLHVCIPCRFGGALDGAARQFTQAYDSNMIPMEFVNTMRKQHQLIMGIGHKVKSVSACTNPIQ